MRAAGAAQLLHVAAPPLPEPESVTDHHVFRPQRSDQHPLDELPGVESREPRVETQHPKLVHPRLRDPLRLVAQAHESRRRRMRREVFLRHRLEADHGRRDPRFASALCQHGEDRLVPEMHAVEIADCHGPAGVPVRAGSDSASNLHEL